jgi:methylmalonyl-CoA mutase cobalamin-binding subunit
MDRKKKALVSGMKSDSHTWNLIFLQMWLEERNFDVNNLGNCVSETEIIKACETFEPDLLVISSVNGHGYIEAVDLIESLHNLTDRMHIVIGGKLAISKKKQHEIKRELLRLGFDGVFIEVDALSEFENYLRESNLLYVGENEFEKKSKVDVGLRHSQAA